MRAADDHIEGCLNTRQTWHPLSATGSWNNTDGDFGLADLCGLRCDAIVAQHRGLQTTAQSIALDRGHDRLPAHLDRLAPFDRRGIALAHLFDVRARDEFAAMADQHHGFYVRVRVALGHAFRHAFRYAGAQGIDRWIIDGDDADGAALLETNEFGHSISPEVLSLSRQCRV